MSLIELSKYRLEVAKIKGKEGYWDTSEASVYLDGKLLLKVERNYPFFPYAFLLDHPNTGHDYLICGSDYQGLTVVNLSSGERKDFLPTSAARGMGFCHTAFKISPNRLLLSSIGCFWGGPYKGMVYEVSDPLSMPWECLFRTNGDVIKMSWDNDTCHFDTLMTVRSSDGKPYHELTDEEADEDPEPDERETCETFVFEERKRRLEKANLRRIAKEERLERLGYEKPTLSERKKNLENIVAQRGWPKDEP